MKISNLVWKVYCDNFNSRSIGVYNIFKNLRLAEGLEKLKKEYKKAKKEATTEINNNACTKETEITLKIDKWKNSYYEKIFKIKLDRLLLYCFWGKCEYEIGLTSWPAYITKEELGKLVTEKTAVKYRTAINLECYEKVDIYDQIKLNFDFLAKYVWENCIV